MFNNYDEEDPHNELDQQFEEKKYEPAAGGWIPLFLLGALLTVGAVVCFKQAPSTEEWAPIELGIFFVVLALIVFYCTCRGITCIDPNHAVILTYCSKYIGTNK